MLFADAEMALGQSYNVLVSENTDLEATGSEV
jgi:hypothetical protein